MKTTKKIFAAFLAVMMLALMIPFSASAADQYSVKITGNPDFTFTIYKVADYSTTEGFTNVAGNADVKSALANATNGTYDANALLAACDASTFTTVEDTFKDKYEDKVDAGVYYVKATTIPSTYTKTGNSVFAVPYVDANGNFKDSVEFSVATKCVSGGQVYFDKYFTDYQTASYISAGINDVVDYTIKASVIGSADAKLKSYYISDEMSAGLTFNNDVAVTLTGGKNNAKDWTLDKDTHYTVDVKNTNNNFDVNFTSTLLNDAAFYNYTGVVVTYSATVNSDAVIAEEGNPNKATLYYKNASASDASKPEEITDTPITVYTFQIDVKKVDAANEENTLEGAKFLLTNGKNVNMEAVTDANGMITFERLAEGTYTLKEVEAPKGYLCSQAEYTVTVSYTVANGEATPVITSGATVENNVVKITNNRVLVPATGGMGTMMFTICGAALILCAGILFLVVRRKNSAE